MEQSEKAAEFGDCSAWLPSHHPFTGDEELVAAPWRETGKRAAIRKAAPLLGEGDEYILGDLLAYGNDDIARLIETGIAGVPELTQPVAPKQRKVSK